MSEKPDTILSSSDNWFNKYAAVEDAPEGVFKGVSDRFSGITVDSNLETCRPEEFSSVLQRSLSHWVSSNRRGVWFKINLNCSHWVPELAKNQFKFHHAKDNFVMMYRWLPKDEEMNIPPYAHTMVGVGALVINEQKQILVVSERHALIKESWKLPGGYVEPAIPNRRLKSSKLLYSTRNVRKMRQFPPIHIALIFTTILTIIKGQELKLTNLNKKPLLVLEKGHCKIRTGVINVIHPINLTDIETTIDSLINIAYSKTNSQLSTIIQYKVKELYNNFLQIKPHRQKRWDTVGTVWNSVKDENFVDAAIREVLEETNVKTKFESLISIRHAHNAGFGCSDLYIVMALTPESMAIKKCDREIAKCEWMHVDDYLNHPKIHETNRNFVRTYLKYKEKGLRFTCKDEIHQILKKQYNIYSLEYDYDESSKL
ncbi:uncharacterized protein LOC131683352 isoform X2 [Topomyia yanbarensis]|nr:uncharacterized protein LOC131683352 isoform X2 [Topomyia yanbarensis]XP_058821225.1 uncharacterized protein LOC131683352 isoform X2 [Topomyia yanbarensis]